CTRVADTFESCPLSRHDALPILILDCAGEDLAEKLQLAGAKLVIHAAGPFQAQSYAVPRACIAARAHYVDLADARAFVSGIGVLDRKSTRLNSSHVKSSYAVFCL